MIKWIFGTIIGYSFSLFLRIWMLESDTCSIISNVNEDNRINLSNYLDRNSELILMAVKVNKETLSHAKTLTYTWAKDLPGKLLFYSTEEIMENEGDIPFIVFKNKTENLSFSLFKYIYDHYIDSFKYFGNIEADTYVSSNKLEQMLTIIEENHKLSNLRNESSPISPFLFCIKDRNGILSRDGLRVIDKAMESCKKKWSIYNILLLMNVYRCLEETSGITCLQQRDVPDIIHKTSKTDFSFFHPQDETTFYDLVFLYPVPNSKSMVQLRVYEESLKIKSKETEILSIQREFQDYLKTEKEDNRNSSMEYLDLHVDDEKKGIFISHLGMDKTPMKKLHFGLEKDELFSGGGNTWMNASMDRFVWGFLSRKERQTFGAGSKESFSYLLDSYYFVERFIIHHVNRESGTAKLDKKYLFYSYFREVPSYGTQFIIDTVLREMKLVPKNYRKHAYVQVPFGPLYIRETKSKTNEKPRSDHDSSTKLENSGNKEIMHMRLNATELLNGERIYMLVALNERVSTFQRFFDNFVNEVVLERLNVVLVLVVYGSNEKSRKKSIDLVIRESKRLPSFNFIILEGEFTDSKSKALAKGVSSLSPEDLLFFIDVDIAFRSDVFDRIRWFTVRGKQVFYPIVFSEYWPVLSREQKTGSTYHHFQYSEDLGVWRDFGYGMVSIYLSDLKTVGGFDTSIIGWGIEDVDVFKKIKKKKDIVIIRAPEPSLVHVYHEKFCSMKLDRNRNSMCYNSLVKVFGSSKTLSNYIVSHPETIEYSKRIQGLSDKERLKNLQSGFKHLDFIETNKDSKG